LIGTEATEREPVAFVDRVLALWAPVTFDKVRHNPKTFPVSSNVIQSPTATTANITAANLGARITDVSAMTAQAANADSRIADQWVR
jgi:hypothetical protein